MSTATPSRPTPPRSRPPRPRNPLPAARAASIDPFRVLRRHLLGLIAATLLGAGLGVAAFFALSRYYPLYTSQVIFEVRPGVREASEIATQGSLQDDDVGRIASTELVLLTSREVLRNAMTSRDVQEKTIWFRENFMEDGTPVVELAVDGLTASLKTSLVRGTELFQVSWSSHRPEDIPIILNSVARAYMDKREALDAEVHNRNLELAKDQLRETNRAIRDLEQEIQDFIIDADITSLTDPRYHETSIAVTRLTAQITEAAQQLSLARSGLGQTQAKLEGTMEPNSDDVLEAERDFAVATHIRTEEALKYSLRLVRERYNAKHPAVLEAEDRLRAAEAERKAKSSEIIRRNLNAKLRIYINQVESLERVITETETELEDKGKKLTELAAQQSQFQALQSQRQFLEKVRDSDRSLIKEIELIRARTDAERVGLAQVALTPRERSFPKAAIIVPLGVLMVLGLTIGIIFLREITDQRVKTASDLAILPGARVLGVIPDRSDDPTKCKSVDLCLRDHPQSIIAESYRQVCAPIGKALAHAGHQTLLLVGGLPGAGTTTAATNIAAGLAASGRRVLIIEANFRRPRLASILALDSDQRGFGDVLLGEATPDAVVTKTDAGFSVMTAGTPASRIIERLNTEAVDQTVARLRSDFDLIIFDAPPAVVAGDAMMLANKLDAAALIVRANQEQRGLVTRLIHQLSDTRCELLGVILNRPRETAGGYFKKNFAVMADYAKKGAA